MSFREHAVDPLSRCPARRFFAEVVGQARGAKLLPDEHFSVDGTLIQAWASMKRFRPKDGSGSGPGPGRNSERDFHGEKRSNDTHASETDTDARLYRKSRGQGAQLCYQSHLLMENRNGLIGDHELTQASGTGERTAAVEIVTRLPGNHRVTVGADRGYDTADFIDDLRCRNATPHVAQNTKNHRLAIDGPPRVIPATRSANASASGSRRPSAGARRSVRCVR